MADISCTAEEEIRIKACNGIDRMLPMEPVMSRRPNGAY